MQYDVSAGYRAVDRIRIGHVAHGYFGRSKCQESVGLLGVANEGPHVSASRN
jgi:hypothetical protein